MMRGMTARAPLSPPWSDGPFRVGDALDDGVARNRLSGLDLHRPFHGLRAHDAATGVVERARDFLPKLEPGACFSHLTAAAIYGMPLPRWAADAPLHVNTPALTRRHRTVGVVGHRAVTLHVRLVDGLPVPSPEEVWMSLAPLVDEYDLVSVGDHLLRRRWPLSTAARMQTVVAASAGRRGNKALRRALERIRSRTDSRRETRLRLTIVDLGLPEPVVAFEVHDADGGFVALVDLAYPQLKIAIEYEGMHHQEVRGQYLSDIDRRRLLENAGWIVVLVAKEHSPARIGRDIREAIARRA